MRKAIPTQNAIAGIWRLNALEDNEVEVLVVTVTVRDPVTGMVIESKVKCPGGGGRPQEPVKVTLQREVLEEVHLSFLPESAIEIWRFKAEDNHTRFGFAIPYGECRGDLPRISIFDDDGDELSEPRFVKLKSLLRRSDFSHREFGESLAAFIDSSGSLR